LEYYRSIIPGLSESFLIDWNVVEGESDFLPQMKSDISLICGSKT
jgi:hypothetical protein